MQLPYLDYMYYSSLLENSKSAFGECVGVSMPLILTTFVFCFRYVGYKSTPRQKRSQKLLQTSAKDATSTQDVAIELGPFDGQNVSFLLFVAL